MQNAVTAGKENKTLDVFKFAACLIITATHLPSIFASETVDLYFNQWFFRFCVPFFFVSTGYFFSKSKNKLHSLKRIAWLFALSYVLYLPAVLEGAWDIRSAISQLRWALVIGYEHLWYLNAILQGLLIWYVLEKLPVINGLFRRFGIPASFALLLLGALLDEHYHLLGNSLLTAIGDFLLVFGGPRNVIFMGFPLLMLGGAAARWEETLRKIPFAVLILAWIILRGLAYWECSYLLKALGNGITNDLTFFGCWPALVLFLISFRFQIPIPEGLAKLLRRMSEYIYILHPLAADLLYKYLELGQPWLLVGTITMCCLLYYLLEKQFVFKK